MPAEVGTDHEVKTALLGFMLATFLRFALYFSSADHMHLALRLLATPPDGKEAAAWQPCDCPVCLDRVSASGQWLCFACGHGTCAACLHSMIHDKCAVTSCSSC